MLYKHSEVFHEYLSPLSTNSRASNTNQFVLQLEVPKSLSFEELKCLDCFHEDFEFFNPMNFLTESTFCFHEMFMQSENENSQSFSSAMSGKPLKHLFVADNNAMIQKMTLSSYQLSDASVFSLSQARYILSLYTCQLVKSFSPATGFFVHFANSGGSGVIGISPSASNFRQQYHFHHISLAGCFSVSSSDSQYFQRYLPMPSLSSISTHSFAMSWTYDLLNFSLLAGNEYNSGSNLATCQSSFAKPVVSLDVAFSSSNFMESPPLSSSSMTMHLLFVAGHEDNYHSINAHVQSLFRFLHRFSSGHHSDSMNVPSVFSTSSSISKDIDEFISRKTPVCFEVAPNRYSFSINANSIDKNRYLLRTDRDFIERIALFAAYASDEMELKELLAATIDALLLKRQLTLEDDIHENNNTKLYTLLASLLRIVDEKKRDEMVSAALENAKDIFMDACSYAIVREIECIFSIENVSTLLLKKWRQKATPEGQFTMSASLSHCLYFTYEFYLFCRHAVPACQGNLLWSLMDAVFLHFEKNDNYFQLAADESLEYGVFGVTCQIERFCDTYNALMRSVVKKIEPFLRSASTRENDSMRKSWLLAKKDVLRCALPLKGDERVGLKIDDEVYNSNETLPENFYVFYQAVTSTQCWYAQ